jgi:hypothetical protein
MIETLDSLLTEESIPNVFKNVAVLAECFDETR